MLRETFVCADTHFGHKNMLNFTDRHGEKLRPWNTLEEMDEALVSNWNKKVPVNSKVYVLGDVVINRKHLSTIGRLNGKKVLIKGNHDVFRLQEYSEYFVDVCSSYTLQGNILTHIPIHPSSLSRWKKNIHGHLHNDVVRLIDGSIDTRYVCVSMEHINFEPIALDEIDALLFKQHQLKYAY